MPGPASPEEMPEEDRHIKDGPQVVQPLSIMPSAHNLEEFASSSTLHGISHVFHHGRYTARKFLWTMAFLAALGFLSYVYIDRVEFYFQYPHATKLEEEALRSMIFPAVTICNVNILRFSEISGQDLYWAGEFLGFLNSSDKIVAPEKADAEVVKVLSQKLQQSKGERNSPFDFREFHDRVGHQMDQMLIKCRFGTESCNVNDFKTINHSISFRGSKQSRFTNQNKAVYEDLQELEDRNQLLESSLETDLAFKNSTAAQAAWYIQRRKRLEAT